MPPGQAPPHLPLENGVQADPSGTPSTSQSASRWQAAQRCGSGQSAAQTLLPAVEVIQRQMALLLQIRFAGSADKQIPGPSYWVLFVHVCPPLKLALTPNRGKGQTGPTGSHSRRTPNRHSTTPSLTARSRRLA